MVTGCWLVKTNVELVLLMHGAILVLGVAKELDLVSEVVLVRKDAVEV